ncbi:hypothetical protein SK128_022021 [Halocaridina rubra]|uniref:Ig-like domain-containing protein n=1 Tax=Halocaridina rubra TaxID=373956 RepID=A0AAN8X026_HALRR
MTIREKPYSLPYTFPQCLSSFSWSSNLLAAIFRPTFVPNIVKPIILMVFTFENDPLAKGHHLTAFLLNFSFLNIEEKTSKLAILIKDSPGTCYDDDDKGAEGLRITKVSVPSPMSTGEGGVLECEWADDGDKIYALKWYLGLDEFYRWTPAENPPVKTFQVRGNPISVDLDASMRGRVRFHHVTLEAAGVYRCEVSAEAPSFHTESGVASMAVIGKFRI